MVFEYCKPESNSRKEQHNNIEILEGSQGANLEPIYRDLPERKRNRPRRRTGSGRVRERFEALEIPLNSTNQSQKDLQKLLSSLKAISTSVETRLTLFTRMVAATKV